jgi:DNA-binding LytR/AlgR family response regulator
MLKAIAIDDEPIALEVIKTLAAEVPYIELTECSTNVFNAAEYLVKNKIDLVFLDIRMPGMSGVEFIRSIQHPPMVIFTTAYSEHAVQCFELNAIDYLLKPFSSSRFLKACNRALEQYELRKNAATPSGGGFPIFIKSGYDHIRLELEDVLYAESRGNYVAIVTPTQTISTRLTMTEAEAFLSPPVFVRIHRSFIVAWKKVTRVEKKWVCLKDIQLPVGTVYAEEIGKMLQ